MNLDRTQLLISFLLLNLLCCVKQKFGKFCAEKDKIKNLQKHNITFQSVTDEARHNLDLLQYTWLVDEFQQSLKSMVDY